jgi:hypothetical protein
MAQIFDLKPVEKKTNKTNYYFIEHVSKEIHVCVHFIYVKESKIAQRVLGVQPLAQTKLSAKYNQRYLH